MAKAAPKPIIVAVTTLSQFGPLHFFWKRHARLRFRLAAELRLDLLSDWRKVLDNPNWFRDQLAHVKQWWGLPSDRLFIATCRRRADGGQFDGTERQRVRVLERAAEHADLVDVEDNVSVDALPVKIIRSHHDRRQVPRFEALHDKLRRQPHSLIKIVGTARTLAANLAVRDFLRRAASGTGAFLMGPYGVPSRILAHVWGSGLSYHAMGAAPYAPGMITLRQFTDLYRGHKLKPGARVFGVTGTRVESSRSPALHNAWIARRRVNAAYLPLKAVDFADFRKFAHGLPLAGASVTIPFKADAFQACARTDSESDAVGVCNTVLVKGKKLHGFNTDTPAFMKDVRSVLRKPLRDLRVLVLGAGGSARAVISGLTRAGCAISVWARRPKQVRDLVHSMGVQPWRPAMPGPFGMLVNTTPCGMPGVEPTIALPWEDLEPVLARDALVFDLVTQFTRLLYVAESFRIRDGSEMLSRQGWHQAGIFGYRPSRRQSRRFVEDMERIWLIGPRASGKSTLAPALAHMLGCVPEDTDAIIKRTHRRLVIEMDQILNSKEFRAAETEAMKVVSALPIPAVEKRRRVWRRVRNKLWRPADKIADEDLSASVLGHVHYDQKVIATGGGIVENPDNVSHMRMFGTVIFLDAPEELLVERLKRDPGGRPSLTGKPVHEEVHEILARRRPLYEAAAHITIKADRPPHVLAGEIVDRLAQFEP